MMRRMPPDRAGRILDLALDVLMRPRVRRWRRWSFLVTLPAAALAATVVDLRSGALVVAARMALWTAVALVAWRIGGERGEAVRDLLMHPRVRRLVRAEVDVVLAIPRLALAALVTRPPRALRYSRGDAGPLVAAALVPSVVAEALLVHLLIPSGWVVAHIVAAVVHGYALVWLLGWGLGSRAYPHRVGDGALVARNGPLFRVRVPLDSIAGATARRERAAGAGVLGDGVAAREDAALLPSRGRVDLWLDLDRPVLVRRPLGEPLAVTRLALASDDAEALVALLRAGGAPERRCGRRAVAALAGGELAGGLRDALQPA